MAYDLKHAHIIKIGDKMFIRIPRENIESLKRLLEMVSDESEGLIVYDTKDKGIKRFVEIIR